MITINNEKLLLEQLKKGDEIAFSNLYMRYHKAIYFYAMRYLKDRDLAQDITQSVFIRIWEERKSIDSSSHFSGYIFTILKNRILDQLKHLSIVKNKHLEIYNELLSNHSYEIEEKLEAEEVSKLLKDAITNLSPQKQKICHLKLDEGLDNHEIAQKLGVSVNTIKVQYSQIIKELRTYIKEELLFFILLLLEF